MRCTPSIHYATHYAAHYTHTLCTPANSTTCTINNYHQLKHRAVGEEGDWQEEDVPPGSGPTDAQLPSLITPAEQYAADTAAAVAAARVVLRWMRRRREREAQRAAAEAAWDGDEVSCECIYLKLFLKLVKS
jgi:hypothetical protein